MEICFSKMNENKVKDLTISVMSNLSWIAEQKYNDLFSDEESKYNNSSLKTIFEDLCTVNVDSYRSNFIKLLKLLQKYDSEFTDTEFNKLIKAFDSFDTKIWYNVFNTYDQWFVEKYIIPCQKNKYPFEDSWIYQYPTNFDLAIMQD